MSTIPANFAQVNVHMTGPPFDGTAEITFGCEAIAVTDPVDIATAVATAWDTNMRGFYVSAITVVNIHVKVGPNLTGPSGDLPVTLIGILTGEAMAGNTSTLIRKNTASGGRAGVGRMFVPGMSEGSIGGDSEWDSTQLAARQTNADAFLADLATASINMVVLHEPGSPLTAPSIVTSLSVAGRLATQRRRMRR